MSAGNVIVQIRRNASRFDFIPAYSTDELLRGVCHVAHFPAGECLPYSPVPESVRAAHGARQEISRKKFEENQWCRKENIDPESLIGISVWSGWVQGQLSFIEMINPEFKRLREIERRYLWIEEHLEDFDQLNIPGIEK